MKTEEEVLEFFSPKLSALQELFAEKKAEAFRKAWKSALGAAVLCIAAGVAVRIFIPDEVPPEILLIGGAAVTAVVWGSVLFHILSQRGEIFKEQVIRQILSFHDPELRYDPKRCFPRGDYMESGIFTHYPDRYTGEDLVYGRCDGIPLAFSELHTQYKTVTRDSKGHRHTTWHDIFRGVFFKADFNKHFQGYTLVVPDMAEKFFGQSIGNFLQKLNVGRAGHLVRLENPVFEKEFAVYSTDQVEARYILTPKMMEHILAIRKHFGTTLSLSFSGAAVYIAVKLTKDLFEFHGGTLTEEDIRAANAELTLFLRLIDELELRLRIWTKE